MTTNVPDDIQRAFDAYLAYIFAIGTAEDPNDEYEDDDDAQEAKLAQLLEPFSEPERLAFIEAGLLRERPVGAMIVAELCLAKKESFRAIIRGGFPYLGSAQIRYWLTQSLLYVDKSELLTYINDLSGSPGMKRMALFYYKGLTKVRPDKKQA